ERIYRALVEFRESDATVVRWKEANTAEAERKKIDTRGQDNARPERMRGNGREERQEDRLSCEKQEEETMRAAIAVAETAC
ncbi:hypothetical protein HN011_008903, partial [Eciton burchellii]